MDYDGANKNYKEAVSRPEGEKKRERSELLQWIEAIALALVIAWLLRSFVFERAIVEGHSMEDTLNDREHLIVYKLGYFFNEPRRGDIVVIEMRRGAFNTRYLPFFNPGKLDYIKRIVGLPGEEVDIRDGYVYVNGLRLDEPYVKVEGATYEGALNFPVRIPEGKYLVLGDNRENSSDSREFGLVDKESIRGKAVFRIFPANRMGLVH